MPFKIHQDTNPNDDPPNDVRSQSVVFTTLFKNPALRKDQRRQELNETVATDQGEDPDTTTLPPAPTAAPARAATTARTGAQNFPKPTVSPTKDPHYVYKESPLISRRHPDGGVSGEYIVRSNAGASEKPKMKNAYEEGRYEFKPSRFRQRDPILLSGSSLFGNDEPVKASRQAGVCVIKIILLLTNAPAE